MAPEIVPELPPLPGVADRDFETYNGWQRALHRVLAGNATPRDFQRIDQLLYALATTSRAARLREART